MVEQLFNTYDVTFYQRIYFAVVSLLISTGHKFSILLCISFKSEAISHLKLCLYKFYSIVVCINLLRVYRNY